MAPLRNCVYGGILTLDCNIFLCFGKRAMKRNEENHMFLLSNLGAAYISGINFESSLLCPKVSLPVPKGTPMLASMVKWDHSQTWDVPQVNDFQFGSASGCNASYENMSRIK